MVEKGAKDFNKAMLSVTDLEFTKKLVSKGANNFEEAFRKGLKSYLLKNSYSYFLSQGVDVNKKIKGKNSIQYYASKDGDINVFKMLFGKSKKKKFKI